MAVPKRLATIPTEPVIASMLDHEIEEFVKTVIVGQNMMSLDFNTLFDSITHLTEKITKTILTEQIYKSRFSKWFIDLNPNLGIANELTAGADGVTFHKSQRDTAGYNAYRDVKFTPTYRPVSFSYDQEEIEAKITFDKNEFKKVAKSADTIARLVANKLMVYYRDLERLRDKIFLQAFNNVISLALNTRTSAVVFDPTDDYTIEHKETITLENALKSTEITTYTYVKKDSGGSKYGIIFKDYTANTCENWADAVAKGYILENEILEEIQDPATVQSGADEVGANYNLALTNLGDRSAMGRVQSDISGAVTLQQSNLCVMSSFKIKNVIQNKALSGANNPQFLQAPNFEHVPIEGFVEEINSSYTNINTVIFDPRILMIEWETNDHEVVYRGADRCREVYTWLAPRITINPNVFIHLFINPVDTITRKKPANTTQNKGN